MFEVDFRCGTSATRTSLRPSNSDNSLQWTEPIDFEVDDMNAYVTVVVFQQTTSGHRSLLPGGIFEGPLACTLPPVWRHPGNVSGGPSFYAEVDIIEDKGAEEKSAEEKRVGGDDPFLSAAGAIELGDWEDEHISSDGSDPTAAFDKLCRESWRCPAPSIDCSEATWTASDKDFDRERLLQATSRRSLGVECLGSIYQCKKPCQLICEMPTSPRVKSSPLQPVSDSFAGLRFPVERCVRCPF